MENASKALIIAGAILISIVLIAVGVMVVNGANGAIGTAVDSMTDQEKQIFNNKFEKYEGNQKGSGVKALLSAIISSNATEKEAGTGLPGPLPAGPGLLLYDPLHPRPRRGRTGSDPGGRQGGSAGL